MGPISLLQGIYAKYFGLPLTSIAVVLLVARMFDAVMDPIIGYAADRYFAKRGNRKPFVVAGALLFIISSWFLYVPFGFDDENLSSDVTAGYFLVWFLAFYLGYTLFEIPHMAWGNELVHDSKEKNTVYGVRSFFLFLGSLFFFAMPLLPWFEDNDFTPQILMWSVLVAGMLMLPAMYFCIRYVPSTTQVSVDKWGTFESSNKESWRQIIRPMFFNKPFLILTGAHICTGFCAGMWFTLLFIFVDGFLKLGNYFALVFVISFGFSIVSLRLWFLVANRWGKKTAWNAGMILLAIGTLRTGMLSPELTGWYDLLICVSLVLSGYAAFNIMVTSLLSDIVDYGSWKFGKNRAATYFSIYTLINKSVAALGGSLALIIVAWMGFDISNLAHSDRTVYGLRLAISWIPFAFIVLSIVFIAKIPINTRRHGIVARRVSRQIGIDY